MKKLICVIIILIFCTSCNNTNPASHHTTLQNSSPVPAVDYISHKSHKPETILKRPDSYSPLNYEEQKAIWISYIDLQPMLLDKTEEQFSQNITSAYEKIKSLGCNTVYVHIRSFGDAYYNSALYPYSKNITGEIGVKPDFDPLQIMIEKAHNLGLSFHGWINPMRCETEENMKKIGDNFTLKEWYNNPEKYIEYLVKPENDSHYWLNPAVEEVCRLISEGVKEIVENYDVDGIHIDDYFYPTTDTYFDSATYKEADTAESLEKWRTDNVSKMVEAMYNAVKSVNNLVLFGVSPQGNIENNYDYMYADVKKWCSEKGYLDYIVPQIYFGMDNTARPFVETAKEWSCIVTEQSISLVIGLGAYKINEEDEFINTTGIIGEQIDVSKQLTNYNGFALYNYINLFEPEKNQARRANAELEYIKKAINKD